MIGRLLVAVIVGAILGGAFGVAGFDGVARAVYLLGVLPCLLAVGVLLIVDIYQHPSV